MTRNHLGPLRHLSQRDRLPMGVPSGTSRVDRMGWMRVQMVTTETRFRSCQGQRLRKLDRRKLFSEVPNDTNNTTETMYPPYMYTY